MEDLEWSWPSERPSSSAYYNSSLSSQPPEPKKLGTAVVAEEDVADGVAMQNGSEGRKRRQARLAEENLILKRAVAIQNARQQESGELQRQILELQRACAGYQEQLQQAQRQNYSLGVHLKEALSPQVPSHNNRDVF